MNKKLFIAASIFAIISFIIMATSEEHLLSLCFAAMSFSCVAVAVARIEKAQKENTRIKGMLFSNSTIVKF